jgi:flagellar hook protein FlgE
MLRSLMAGVTGIKAHTTYLDVVGNNIANVNTTGFKKSVTTFQDLLYQTAKGATAPDAGAGRGGINPMQVGLGVNVAAIETIHTQGNVSYTGVSTDFAIQGDGYFVVKDGNNTYYTRAGSFIRDGADNVVSSGTGYMLQGYAMSQDPTDPTKYVQGSTLGAINIPIGQKIPAKETELVGFRCNLDSSVPTYLASGFTAVGTQQKVTLDGTQYTVTFAESAGGPPATPDDFLRITFDGAGGPLDGTLEMQLDGVDAEGNPVLSIGAGSTAALTAATTYDPNTGLLTVQDGTDRWEMNLWDNLDMDYVTFKDPANPNLTWKVLTEFDPASNRMKVWYQSDDGAGGVNPVPMAVFDSQDPAAGPILFNSDGTFRSYDSNPATQDIDPIALDDGAGNTLDIFLVANPSGRSFLIQPSDGGVPPAATGETLGSLNQRISSIHETKIDVYDSLGNAYTLEVSWEKTSNNEWRWRAWLPDNPGIPITGNEGLITFGQDGRITGTGTATIDLGFGAVGAKDTTVTLDFSGKTFEKDDLEGVTQYGSAFTTKGYYQDGYAMGVLEDFAVGADGIVTGVYSNGKNQPIARLALALFANPQGLLKMGETVFMESPNSGVAQIVNPQEGGAGKIAGSSLEMSNVDLAEEFVSLIKGQRGFQANARVVTTGDQVLEELINLKR